MGHQYEDYIKPPEIETIRSFIGDDVSPGIYIPAYQRRFSWGENEYVRFFEDIAGEISAEGQDTYYTLLGNIVCFDDTEKHYVDPGEEKEQPATLYNVVDGQQRLSFIVLLSIAMHQYIADAENDYGGNAALAEEAKRLQRDLENIFSVKIRNNPDLSPKVIRAIEDEWKATSSTSNFTSPIARYTKQYLDYCKIGSSQPFKYDRSALLGDEEEKHDKFLNNMDSLHEILAEFCSQSEKDLASSTSIPAIKEILRNDKLMKVLFPRGLALAKIDAGEQRVFRAILLGNYICKCVLLIVIQTKKDYQRSFSVFSAINSAGKLLNAFEIFVPTVVDFEDKHKGHGEYFTGYHSSPSFDYIKDITNHLDKIGNKKNRDDSYAKELAIAFALSYSGKALEGGLFRQQRFLNEEFASIETPEKKREFVKLLYYVHKARQLYDLPRITINSILQGHEEPDGMRKDLDAAVFCLEFLHDSKFTLSIPILARYLYNMHEQAFDEKSIGLFCQSIKQTASFCALWRSSSGSSTSGIDDELRKVMGCRKLSRKLGVCLEQDELKECFKKPLREKLFSQQKGWAERANQTSMKSCKHVAKFILLVGSHNTCVKPGPQIEKHRAPFYNLTIKEKTFRDDAYATLEHIVPVREQETEIVKYDPLTKDQLWNIVFLPKGINSAVSNNPWRIKQMQYSVFSSETEDERTEKIKELNELKKELGKKETLFKTQMPEPAFSTMTRYLAMIDGKKHPEYTKELGLERNKRLLEFAWEILAKDWLDWEAKGVK